MLSRDDRETIEAARRVLGRELAALRNAAGYIQGDFAPLTGYGRSTLANVEVGRQSTTRQFWKRCADALSAPELLARYDQIEAMAVAARDRTESEAQQARETRIQAWRRSRPACDGGTSPIDEDEHRERLDQVFIHPERADLVAVAHLREHVRGLDEKYDRSPASTLIAEAGRCLGEIEFLAAHARRPDVQRDLSSAEAEAAILMGQLVWDASQRRIQDTAIAYFAQALTAAQRRGDRAYEGLALLRTSMVELYGRKDPVAGLEVAQHAAETSKDASHVLAGLSVLHAAEACAMQGDRSDCEKKLTVAEQYLGQVARDDPAIDLFSATQFGRMAGSCYLFLGDAGKAADLLEQTASSLRDGSKAQAIMLGNLSLARIGQGHVDEAVAALHSALDVIEKNWSGGGMTIAFTAGRKLCHWQEAAAVRDVRDRLLALMAEG